MALEVNLSTLQDAVAFLERQVLPGADNQNGGLQISLTGEMRQLEIRIYGPGYHGELHGELARGIAVFQDEIYRATLDALQSAGIDQKRLSSAQKELVELRIEVQDNCTLIKFDMGDFAKGLKEVLIAMPPDVLAWVLVGTVALTIVGWAAIKLGGKVIDRKQAKDQLQQQQAILQTAQQAETERAKLNAETMQRLVDVVAKREGSSEGQIALRFANASENGVREIATRATHATAVQVGNVELNEAALRDLGRRAPRTSPNKIDVTEPFKIVQMNKAGSPHKVVISGRSYGEFAAEFDETEIQPEKVEAFYNAFKTGAELPLSVSVLISNEKIKFATVVDVIAPAAE